jgi:hypothetical protein
MTTDVNSQPPKKTSPWAWIAIGCAVLVAAVIAFIVFILVFVFGAMRSSAPYRESVALAKSDPRVVALLGSPVRAGYIFGGSINTQGSSGHANLMIPLRGPKGGGILEVQAEKKDGKWTYQVMKVTVKGTEIDLLRESPDTTPPASQS